MEKKANKNKKLTVLQKRGKQHKVDYENSFYTLFDRITKKITIHIPKDIDKVSRHARFLECYAAHMYVSYWLLDQIAEVLNENEVTAMNVAVLADYLASNPESKILSLALRSQKTSACEEEKNDVPKGVKLH